MKKSIAVLMVTTALILMTSCTNSTNNDKPIESGMSEVSETQSIVSETESKIDVKYAEMIPNPNDIFKNGIINITDDDGGKAYMFNVTGYTVDEYDSYILGCKENGFTDISYETDTDRSKDFGAYSADGNYWVQVNLDKENNIIYVICQTSKNK